MGKYAMPETSTILEGILLFCRATKNEAIFRQVWYRTDNKNKVSFSFHENERALIERDG